MGVAELRAGQNREHTGATRAMSASYSQPLRAVLWLLLKLAVAGIVSAGVGYLFGWPVWKLVGLALVVSLLVDVLMAWHDERRAERGEFVLLNDMVGDTGVVTGGFVRGHGGFRGQVRVRGESWSALYSGQRALQPGETVQVRARKGLTLVVDPDGALRKQESVEGGSSEQRL